LISKQLPLKNAVLSNRRFAGFSLENRKTCGNQPGYRTSLMSRFQNTVGFGIGVGKNRPKGAVFHSTSGAAVSEFGIETASFNCSFKGAGLYP
jgi:hypothetical protein